MRPNSLMSLCREENTIAVFAIDQDAGEPTLILNVDRPGIHGRTFALDSSGRILIAG
jgi:6-phosphogluconolactonase